jgi:hypothetical protein
MIIGSIAGGFVPTIFGAGAFSFSSLLGSVVGGILGIWITFKISN